MTLLITVFAAIVATVVWYCSAKARLLKAKMLCYMYWGAAMMWFVDAVFEYKEKGAEFFTPPVEDMINDLYLGLSAVALALVVWLAVVLFKDPFHVVQGAVSHKV